MRGFKTLPPYESGRDSELRCHRGLATNSTVFGRTLTLELLESTLVANGRPPGANLRPPACRDIVGLSAVTSPSKHSNRGDRPVPPLAAGPLSTSIRPFSEVAQ